MTVTERLRAASTLRDAQDYIDRVKGIVREELVELDDSIEIEDTQYFNHSAIPDFVVRWPGGKESTRSIYLRDSYSSIVAGDDEAYLAASDPMILALDTEGDGDAEGDLHPSNRQRSRSRTLVTDVQAVEIVHEAMSSDPNPLAEVLQANFLSGGRGHIDSSVAWSLAAVAAGESNAERESVINFAFAEDAALRVNRTAALMELAYLDVRSEAAATAMEDVSGVLSVAEVRVLLPWILGNSPERVSKAFWQRLASMMSLGHLQGLRAELQGLDLTPLMQHAALIWSASLAYLGVATPTAIAPESLRESRGGYWHMGTTLNFTYGEQRIAIANGGKHLKPRESSSSARWENLAPRLESYRLAGVALRGVTRSITVDAVQSPDVRQDVQDVTQSLEDQYHVSTVAVTLPVPGEDGVAPVELDFGKSLARASKRASIADLATLVIDVLDYRRESVSAEVTLNLSGNETAE